MSATPTVVEVRVTRVKDIESFVMSLVDSNVHLHTNDYIEQTTWCAPDLKPFSIINRALVDMDGKPIADNHEFDSITFQRETETFQFYACGDEDICYEYKMSNLSFNLDLVVDKKRAHSNNDDDCEPLGKRVKNE